MQTHSLTEKFFLLSMDRYKATFANWHSLSSFDIGISGALVFELLLAKRLVLSENKEFLEDKNVQITPVWAEEILHTIEDKLWFTILLGKKHEKTLGNWLKVMRTQSFSIKENTEKDLKAQSILAEKPTKVLGITVGRVTYLKETEVLLSLKKDIEQTILDKKVPDLSMLMLLRLIKGTETLREIFPEKPLAEQKKLEQGLETLFQKEEVITVLRELLAESRQREEGDSDDVFDFEIALDVISEAIDSVGDGVDGGSDGGGDGGGGDGGD